MSDLPARSFGSVADSYDRGRPSYPEAAVSWLTGERPATVLELGAGTGLLTTRLVERGHDVLATDPDEEMLARLSARLPDVRTAVAAAEDLPVADRSVDVVACAQAFHWFDADQALPEIARVLRPGGRLALVWNQPDLTIPWVRRLSRLIGDQEQRDDLAQAVVMSPHFGFVEEAAFRHWQRLDRTSVVDLACSRSNIATLEEAEREAKLAEVVELYDDYGRRGVDGMQLPYTARCYRATVTEGPGRTPAVGFGSDPAPPPDDPHTHRSPRKQAPSGPLDGTDTDLLLIDFR
ncbi:class I SAM-dependent methyltransferase [Nocardioides ochotonae]|uniref:class I SAM-dependent methyltransferase n=1 Tax=Nocardioides ochotonae TaxID=2685869 RepID=UPI00140C270E|nr:class I SAM-dependent methyltransferase [Nocardioides ochotonae]